MVAVRDILDFAFAQICPKIHREGFAISVSAVHLSIKCRSRDSRFAEDRFTAGLRLPPTRSSPQASAARLSADMFFHLRQECSLGRGGVAVVSRCALFALFALFARLAALEQ